jgi:hypothetical protein
MIQSKGSDESCTMHQGCDLLVEPKEVSRAGRLNCTQPQVRFSPLVWLNLLCLDAPIVAVAWQWLFGHSFHISLTGSSRVSLFVTAWVIYLADRFADAVSLRPEDPKSLRQQFCLYHAPKWVALLAGVAFLDGWIISRYLDEATVVAGLFVGAASLCYLATNYWLGGIWQIVPIKEISIGSLFAAGTIAALVPKVEQWSPALIASFLFFAFLCSLNCISIAIWERVLDQTQNKNSLATRWPAAGRYLRISVIVLACLSLVIGLVTKAPLIPFILIETSALLLGLLDLVGSRIPRDKRTALADLILLTPLLLLILRSVA